MKTRVAINGFGRIGRNFLRTVLQDKNAQGCLDIVAINIGPARPEYVAHMFKYDTLMGTYPGEVTLKDSLLVVDGYKIKVVAECDPLKISWKELQIDWVVEASGFFTKRDGAEKHCTSGAKKVLITAPAQGEDVTIVPGVNSAQFNPEKHTIVSLGSCTTNAMATMLKVLNDTFTIQQGMMTTVHAYTNTQVLLDVERKDLRRSRAAALNIIPTTTGASALLAKIIPELDGKVAACALRVPVAKVSLIDFAFTSKQPLSVESINTAFTKAAASGSLQGVLAINNEPLVSSDYSGCDYSAVVDAQLTSVVDGLGKVFGWYDNEWGYSVRLKDFLVQNSQ